MRLKFWLKQGFEIFLLILGASMLYGFLIFIQTDSGNVADSPETAVRRAANAGIKRMGMIRKICSPSRTSLRVEPKEIASGTAIL